MGARKIQELADEKMQKLKERKKAGLEKTDIFNEKMSNLKLIKEIDKRGAKNAKNKSNPFEFVD